MRRNLLLGLAFSLCLAFLFSVPRVYAQLTADMVQVDINHRADFWGIPMDCDYGTPAWHVRAAIAHLLDKQQFVSTFVPLGTVIENPVPKTTLLTAWYLNWLPLFRWFADPWHGVGIGLYNVIPMAPDIGAAVDHLEMTGVWLDSNNDDIIDNPPMSRIIIIAPDWNAIRQQLANYLEDNIETVFGADVVDVRVVSFSDVYNTVFDVTTEDDWHLYMGGWRVPNTPPPDWLYELYHTDSITSPIAFNYGFYSNPVYDLLVSLTMTPFTARAAQFVFGFTIGTIPVWSQI